MAEEIKQQVARTDPLQMRLQLTPANESEQPILANTTMVMPGSGFIYVDFGFIEPGVLPALGQVARQGGKMPEQINGRLAARLALSFDVVQQLHQQLGNVLEGLQRAQAQGAAAGRAPAKADKKG